MILTEPAFSNLGSADCVIHLLSHLYVQRSFPLWKKPDRSKWFADTVIAADKCPFQRSGLRARALEFFGVPVHRTSVWRHAVMQDSSFKNLLTFVPPSTFDRSWFSSDPLPPVQTAVSQYDSEFFSGLDAMRLPDRHLGVFEDVEEVAEVDAHGLEVAPEIWEDEYENEEPQEDDGEGPAARETSEEGEDEGPSWVSQGIPYDISTQ